MIKVGEKFPQAILSSFQSMEGVCGGQMSQLQTQELFQNKKVVLFSVPGAFTPTCSAQHVPGFLKMFSQFKQKKVDLIACVSVNDAFVMEEWRKSQNVTDQILMLSDGSANLAKQLGLVLDLTEKNFGLRMKRSAFIIDNNVVSYIAVDESGFKDTSAESVFSKL